MIKHSSPISGISSFDSRYVLTAGYDNQVVLWDTNGHTALARGNHDHLANQCAFSACGKYAASSSSDYSVRIWEVPTMRLVSVLTGHHDDVEGLAFHPSRPLLACASRDKRIGIFNYEENTAKFLEGHKADVLSVIWKGDTQVLISSSDDGSIRTWDVDAGLELDLIDLDGVETDTIAVTEDGTIYAGNDEGEILVIRNRQRSSIRAHEAGIKKLVFDPRESLLVSLSYDGTVKIWTCREGDVTLKCSAKLPLIVWPRSCTILDRDTIAFVTFGDRYAVFDMNSGTWHTEAIRQTNGLNAVCELNGDVFSVGDSGTVKKNDRPVFELHQLCNFIVPFNGRLITGGQSGAVLNALTGECYYRHRSPINCASAYVDHGVHKIVLGTYTGEVLQLSCDQTGEVKFEQCVRFHPNAIKGITVSGKRVFSVCADRSAAFHCPTTLKRLKYFEDGHFKIANGCCSLSDDKFVSVSRDLNLRIWKDEEVDVIKTPSKNSIKCVASSSDANFVAIGNYFGFAGIFDVRNKTWSSWGRVSASGVSSIAFSPSQGDFLISTYDGHLHRLHPIAMECKSAA